MSELGDKQKIFTYSVAQLIIYAYSIPGHTLTVGDAYRDPRVFGHVGKSNGYGRKKSLHKQRLAMDFNLFVDGEYMTSTEDFIQLGKFWEGLGEEHSWGGRFSDGNHFSIMYRGMR